MLFAICFNRNIVECKVSIALTSDPCMQVLIETLWNVKGVPYATPRRVPAVLIETLWNVKIGAIAAADKPDMVLIETLWNVK